MAKFFPPTITTAQRTAITPDKGEIMFDSDLDTFYLGDGSTVGGVTLKGDTGDVGPPGPLGAVVDDTSPQLGGFLDPNGNYIGMGKGGDIASSSPLVIDIDGDYFDVTGTNSFSTMTVTENRFFILEFDAVLTITHGGSITLPGSTNFTTAAGDHLLCFSSATNTVQVVAITKADGTDVVSGLFNVSEDTTPQLGGFLDPNGNYIGSEKGGDIASISPLVLGINGDYFDVTGTTGFSSITVAANRLFRLQFDGILTITHGGSITLPGASNFTTAAGDEITFFSTAANTVRVVAITKADGSAVVSGLFNVSEDTTPQLGGFLDPNGNYIGSEKGGDIPSNQPLIIDTDGDYFDITGTTSFSTMTVTENRLFRLHFDGILTITHGGSITLPGSTNFTTAAGDEITFFSTAANTVRVVAITKADGTPVISPNGGGAWNLIGTIQASDDATLTITGLDSTYDTYAIGLSDLRPGAGSAIPQLRAGDSGGIDIGSGDYSYVYSQASSSSPGTYNGEGSTADTHIKLGGIIVQRFGGMLFLHRPGDGTSLPSFSGTCAPQNSNGKSQLCVLSAHRTAVIILDRIQFLFSSANVLTGRMTIWGISHE